MSINRVNITGNLTRDPELRSTQSGTSVLTFGVAVNDRRRNPQTGDWEDYPNFIDCVVFGNRAEPLSRFLSKGSKVAVEGKLRWSQWERDGQKRSKIEVVVDEVEFLSPRNSQGQQGGGYAGGQQAYGGQQGYGNQQPYGGQQPQQYAPVQQPQPAYQQAPSYSAPAPAPQQMPSQGDPTQRPVVTTPPSADVYDEDIPF